MAQAISTTTLNGTTLTLDVDAMLVRLSGDVDKFADVGEAEINAFVERYGLFCTWRESDSDAYHVEVPGKGIESLRRAAGQAGDLAQVELCDLASEGDAVARQKCASVIVDAAAG